MQFLDNSSHIELLDSQISQKLWFTNCVGGFDTNIDAALQTPEI